MLFWNLETTAGNHEVNRIQGNKFDKIFKENMKVTLPLLMNHIVNIDIAYGYDLPTDLQYTKERKPDMLRRIKAKSGKEILIHVEYQTTNDSLMVCRMAEYNVMLRRAFKIRTKQSIKQYVLFFGRRKARMAKVIHVEELKYHYNLIQVSEIDYEVFLHSDHPEDQILAILADLKGNDPKSVLSEILLKLHSVARGELANNKYVNQLQVLTQLRKLENDFKLITTMGPISSFFKKEKDPFYKDGRAQGIQEGQQQAFLKVAREMKAEGLPDTQIAKITKIPVKKIQEL